jgi:hypothetical protein
MVPKELGRLGLTLGTLQGINWKDDERITQEHCRPVEEKSAFLQEWLFFSLLSTFLKASAIELDPYDLICNIDGKCFGEQPDTVRSRTDAKTWSENLTEGRFVITKRLEKYLYCWFDSIKSLSEAQTRKSAEIRYHNAGTTYDFLSGLMCTASRAKMIPA